jgi:Na+/H+ antiporter NhaA
MSLFITNLAIDATSSIRVAKISVLLASFIAILLSALLFQVVKKRNRHAEVEA